MPTVRALYCGYAIVRRRDFPGIVGFVVTVGDGDVTEAIVRNLRACLTDSQIEQQNDIWIPLLGMGAGRLKMTESMKAILQASKASHFLDKENAPASMAVPKEIFKSPEIGAHVLCRRVENQNNPVRRNWVVGPPGLEPGT